MSHKRVIIGQAEWTIDDSAVEMVVAQISDALENSTVARLDLLDGAGRRVIVFLNGRVTGSVVLDLDQDTRPGEMS